MGEARDGPRSDVVRSNAGAHRKREGALAQSIRAKGVKRRDLVGVNHDAIILPFLPEACPEIAFMLNVGLVRQGGTLRRVFGRPNATRGIARLDQVSGHVVVGDLHVEDLGVGRRVA